MLNSPFPMSTTKIHPHVERFSLNLAERPLYIHGCKKHLCIIRKEEGKWSGQNSEKRENIRGQKSTLRGNSEGHGLGVPVLGSRTGKMSPLGWMGTTETNRRVV